MRVAGIQILSYRLSNLFYISAQCDQRLLSCHVFSRILLSSTGGPFDFSIYFQTIINLLSQCLKFTHLCK